jgi:hypothetical protein
MNSKEGAACKRDTMIGCVGGGCAIVVVIGAVFAATWLTTAPLLLDHHDVGATTEDSKPKVPSGFVDLGSEHDAVIEYWLEHEHLWGLPRMVGSEAQADVAEAEGKGLVQLAKRAR